MRLPNRRRLIRFLCFAAILIVPLLLSPAFAASASGANELDIEKGSVTITASTITGRDSSGASVSLPTSGGCVIMQSESAQYPGFVVTTNRIIVAPNSGDVYVTVRDIYIYGEASPITVGSGSTLHLLLSGSNRVFSCNVTSPNYANPNAGINVPAGAALVIDKVSGLTDAEASLSVEAADGKSSSGAAIGSGNGLSSGEITINGGTVSAISHSSGAGIGTGSTNNGSAGSYANSVCGDIVINGGIVTATGGDSYGGAGIGGGYGGNGGTVIIRGGTVTASGGTDAAGIGGGVYGTGGSLLVTDGKLHAIGDRGGAGIGGGYAGNGGITTIEGGFVYAENTARSSTSAPSVGRGAVGTKSLTSGATVLSGGSLRADGPVLNSATTASGATLYRTYVDLPAGSDDKRVFYTLDGGSPIPTFTDANGRLYLWLTSGLHTVSVTCDGNTYTAKDSPYTDGYIKTLNPTNSGAYMNWFELSTGTVSPEFDDACVAYTVMFNRGVSSFTIKMHMPSNSVATLAGVTLQDNVESAPIPITSYADKTTLDLIVTAPDGVQRKKYTLTIDRVVPPAITMVTPADQTYTGQPITPAVTVRSGGADLSENVDYTLSYSSDRTNVGTVTVNATGIGRYAGSSVSGTFKILPRVVLFTVDPISSAVYTGSPILLSPVVRWGTGSALQPGTDYRIIYPPDTTNSGSHTLSVEGVGNYSGSSGSQSFTILPLAITFSAQKISPSSYTGSSIKPVPTVLDPQGNVIDAANYTLLYPSDTVHAGGKTIRITGTGNYWGSSGEVTYTIQPRVIDFAIADPGDFRYTGSEITPAPVVKDGSKTLLPGVDYSVRFEGDKVNTGTVEIVVSGIGDYEGSEGSITYMILPIADSLLVAPTDDVIYTGSPAEPAPTVTYDNKTLQNGVDYTVTYSRQSGSGNHTDVGNIVATVRGIGNYLGSSGQTAFQILPKATSFRIDSLPDSVYTGTAPNPEPTVYDGTTLLTKDTDYSVRYVRVVDKEAEASVGSVRIELTGIGNYEGSGGTSVFQIIPRAVTCTAAEIPDLPFTGADLCPDPLVADDLGRRLTRDKDYRLSYENNRNQGTASIKIEGIGNYEGSQGSKEFQILPSTNFTVSPIAERIYSGEALTPDLLIRDQYGNSLREGVDYTASYTENRNVGTAGVTVLAKGNYSGTVTTSFSIARRPLSLLMSVQGSGAAADKAILTVQIGNAAELPTGRITFRAGENILSSDVAIQNVGGQYLATYEWLQIPEGNYTITAEYIPAANDNYSAGEKGILENYSVRKQNQEPLRLQDLRVVYGDPAIRLHCDGGSGSGSLTYTILSGADTVRLDGTTLSFLGSGVARIGVVKAGDDAYNPTSASFVVTIGKAIAAPTAVPEPTSSPTAVPEATPAASAAAETEPDQTVLSDVKAAEKSSFSPPILLLVAGVTAAGILLGLILLSQKGRKQK